MPRDIRKVQAIPDSPEASGKSCLFPPGLRVVVSSHDADEMSGQALFWGLEQSQLGRGRFEGGIRAIHSGQVQLSRTLRSPGLMIQGAIPRETVVLSSVL